MIDESQHKLPPSVRVSLILLVVLVLIGGLVGGVSYSNDKYKDSGDKNVYLNEEICFADEIFIKVNSINVTTDENEGTTDEDGDLLSNYTLNLGVIVEQRHTDIWVNKEKIKPSHFKLKSVNMNSKSKMAVFFECLAKETITAMVTAGLTGSVNIIEETINFATEYTTASIENAENSAVAFKPIKCVKDSFEAFYPYKVEGPTALNISFPIKKDYLESESIIVLAVDALDRIEKRIFLITRLGNNA